MKKSRKTKPQKLGKVPKSLITEAERKHADQITAAIMMPKRTTMSDTTKSIILKSDPLLGSDGAILQYAVTRSIERDQKIEEANKISAAEADGILRHLEAYNRYVLRNRNHQKFNTRWEKDIRLYEEFIFLRPYRLEGFRFCLSDRRRIRKWFWQFSQKERANACAHARQHFNEIRASIIGKRVRYVGAKSVA